MIFNFLYIECYIHYGWRIFQGKSRCRYWVGFQQFPFFQTLFRWSRIEQQFLGFQNTLCDYRSHRRAWRKIRSDCRLLLASIRLQSSTIVHLQSPVVPSPQKMGCAILLDKHLVPSLHYLLSASYRYPLGYLQLNTNYIAVRSFPIQK